MFQKKLTKNGLAVLTAVTALAFSQAGSALTVYSNDFEHFTTGDVDDFVIGNIVNGGAGWFPGTFGAPGDYNNGYSAIVNEGGTAQGAKQLSIFSDYNAWSPFTAGPGTTIQAFVYRDHGTIAAGDVGKTFRFSFDAKLGNLAAPSQAEAFIKVLKQSDNTYFELANNTFDSDANLTINWGGGFVDLLVDAGMVGELVQFGFNNTATDWGASGVVYDNLGFAEVSAVPVPAAAWLFGSGLLGLVGVARRKK